MEKSNRLNVDSSAIFPMINEFQTQFVFQRHCNYDRNNGLLLPESVSKQKEIVKSFIVNMSNIITLDDLKNTYFLFTSSNTISSVDFKRCVETTNIAMKYISEFLKSNNISLDHIINFNEKSNYNNQVHEDKLLTEPKMFTDSTGYLDYLKTKHNGININFWIDFEEDLSKEVREQLSAEGPDEIVERAVRYINVLSRYANIFNLKYPNSRLIIWNGTHYDLISPLVKQKILDWEKFDIVNVDYCGGISLVVDKEKNIVANVNGINYPFDFQDSKQLHRHF